MVEWAKKHNMALTAYSPLGNPGYSWFSSTGYKKTLEHPAVLKAAEKYNKSPVQVLINWGVARGYCGKFPNNTVIAADCSCLCPFSHPEVCDPRAYQGQH